MHLGESLTFLCFYMCSVTSEEREELGGGHPEARRKINDITVLVVVFIFSI